MAMDDRDWLQFGVVYFGNSWYAENRTSSHHVANRLARLTPVLYVDSPGMRAPTMNGRDFRRIWQTLLNTFSRPRPLAHNLWHCTVAQLPMRRLPGVEALNRIFGKWAVKRAMRHIGLKRPVAWFVVPHPGFLTGRLGESLCVYYCTDDYAAHPGVDSVRIAASDDALTRSADLVFVVPPALLESKRRQNPSATFAPHGVDADHFALARESSTPLPESLPSLRKPVVGYIGSLHAWIDFGLIAWLASQRPQWDFLLVGHAHTEVDALRELSNVHLVGAQPYEDLPRWAKVFDAAIIPYRDNRQITNANPLKLREYLAAGLPVVSTRNPEIESFSHLVHIHDDREGFLASLDAVVATPVDEDAGRRMAAVASQTWDRRVDNVVEQVRLAFRAKVLAMQSDIKETPLA